MGLQLLQHQRILRCIGQHRDIVPIFCSTAHHGGPANVDVLNRILQTATWLGHRRFKRVEVHDQNINGRNAVLGQRRLVRRQIAARQQAAVNLGMQGLHATVEHFGKARHVGHLGHR